MSDKPLSVKYIESQIDYNSHNSEKWRFFEGIEALEKELKGYKEWVDDKERLLKNDEQESQALKEEVKELKATIIDLSIELQVYNEVRGF